MGGTLFAVVNQSLYIIPSAGLAILLGPIPGTGPVFMANNGTQLMIVNDETRGFIATFTTLVEITDPDFPTAGSLTFIDGYFVIHVPGTKRFYISALNDGLSWDALDFASAEADPDSIVACFSDHRELWLFGEKTTELWSNTGASPFPFERISGAYLTRGCAAAKSIASLDNTLFWLGDDFIVYRADGYSPARISTHEIENLIGKVADKSRITAATYTQEGHTFYCLTLPNVTTAVYDASTGLWHERQSFGRTEWIVSDITNAYGGAVAGSAVDGKIYTVSLDTFTDGGGTIIRTIQTPSIWADGQRMTMSRLQLDLQAGVGLNTGQGSDPIVTMAFSNDGGNTWSAERQAKMGKIGEYKKRCQWWRLGQFRDRRFRFAISDPVQVRILGLYGDTEPGRI